MRVLREFFMARRERKTKVTKKGGAGGKIICLLLGFILGVVGTVGGVGGLGYYAVATVSIKDAVGTVNNLAGTNIEYTDYINEEYGNGTTLSLILDVADAVKNIQGEKSSLATFDKISPLVGKNVQKLIDSVSGYGVTIDYTTLMETPFSKLGDFVTQTVNGTEIAPLVESVTKNKVEGLLALICYGEENEDYVVNDDGTVTMLGTSTSATIGSLTNSGQLNDRLMGLSFQSLMGSMGSINDEDPIIRTLVYGIEGEDYALVDDDNNPETPDVVVQLPKTYNFDPVSLHFTAPNGTDFAPSADGVWTAEGGAQIVKREDTSVYYLDVLNANAEIVYNLKPLDIVDGINRFQAYIGDVAQVRKGVYLSDVMGENADLMGIVGKIRLGDLLDLNGSSDSIMLSVAYGEKNVDYTVDPVTNEIIPITDPITIGDLIGGNGMDLIKGINLASMLGITSPLDDNFETLLIMLAYGEEGVQYQLVDKNGDGTMDDYEWLRDENGEYYKERTVGELIDSNETLFNDLTIATLLNVQIDSPAIMRAIAYGNEGTHYQLVDTNSDGKMDKVEMLPKKYAVVGGTVYDEEQYVIGTLGSEAATGVYEVNVSAETKQYIKLSANGGYDVYASLEDAQNTAEDMRLLHAKTKLVNLRGGESASYIERIELASVLGVDIFATGADAADPLMIALAYGNEGVHYTLDRANEKILWNTNPATGLSYHARTIHDMKDGGKLIDDIYLETALGLTHESPAIMLSLAYGPNYVIDGTTVTPAAGQAKRTITDLKGSNAKALIDSILMKDIIAGVDTDDAIMRYLLYGTKNVHYKLLADGSIEMLPMQLAYVSSSSNPSVYNVYDAQGKATGAVLENTSNVYYPTTVIDGVTYKISTMEVVGSVEINGVATNLYRVYKVDDTVALCSPRTLGAFMNNSSDVIDGLMDTLTLREALGDESCNDKILKHVADLPIKNIGDELHTLSIQKVLEDDIYRFKKFRIEGGEYVYDEVNGTEKMLATPVVVGGATTYKAVYYTTSEMTRSNETFTLYTYYTYGDNVQVDSPLLGCWKYLLIDSKTGLEREYALEDMNSATNNMTNNMQNATLNALHSDNIIRMEDSSFLTHEIYYEIKIGLIKYYVLGVDGNGNVLKYTAEENGTTVTKEYLGELTVNEALDYIVKFLAVIDNLPNG